MARTVHILTYFSLLQKESEQKKEIEKEKQTEKYGINGDFCVETFIYSILNDK